MPSSNCGKEAQESKVDVEEDVHTYLEFVEIVTKGMDRRLEAH